jgi:putative ABC transport system ATP-binding protein
MIRLHEVSKRYGHKQGEVVALHETSLTVNPGDFVAIVGPSGSGKTTLLSMLGGMLAPSTGSVKIDDHSLYELDVDERADIRQQKIGFVFQTFNLITYLTALENVQIPLMLAGMPKEQQHQRVLDLLTRVGLECRLHHKPTELSVGQRQRVALARTLVSDPDVILADEPTGNLDPDSREHVLHFLESLAREGRTVIMVTHDPHAAKRAARVVTLCDGKVASDTNKAKALVA